MLRWKDDQEEWQGVVKAAEDSLETSHPPIPYQCKCKGMVGESERMKTKLTTEVRG